MYQETIKQIEYKKTPGEKIISLMIDEDTQAELLKNQKLVQSISPVFEAVGKMQDKLDKDLTDKIN